MRNLMFNHNFWSIKGSDTKIDIFFFVIFFLFLLFYITDYFYFQIHHQHFFSLRSTSITRTVESPYFWGIMFFEFLPFLFTFINREFLNKIILFLLIFYIVYELYYVLNFGTSFSLLLILWIRKGLKENSP